MSTEIIEWLHLIFRFAHVVAAIMWIGSSIFFMWLDSHLTSPQDEKERDSVEGELWMIHGGGIFHSRKRILKPGEIPELLHWFKWEAYATWLTGFSLLVLIYFLQSGTGALIGLAVLGGGWLVYDLLWRSALGRRKEIGVAVCFVLLMLISYWLCRVLSGKAAFLYIGAMLGTMMAGNVFVHIIPNQKKMLAALCAGEPHDIDLGKHAKLRSTHNNYLTFPVLFLMLSGHFPQMWSNDRAWIVLGIMVLALAAIKHWMNIRERFPHWLPATVGTFLIAAVSISFLKAPQKLSEGASAVEKGKLIFTNRGCVACHQAGPIQQGPSLVGIFGMPQVLTDGSSVIADEAYLRESILEPQKKIVKGYMPIMPPYEGIISDEELNFLISYLKELHE
ncbi:MAG: urate hydroxylase PuuD [Verrucomicrobiales bacterium]|nr:urate hydroxylase PuuD [Verrucomicrobiales bacterium]